MWIGTGNYGPGYPGMGLYKYDPNHELFHFFDIREGENGLWGTEIAGMYKSQNGDMWFATEHGITHLDSKNNQFTDFYPTDGFWGKVTASVLEANDGSVWVSTKNFGISKMNPQTKEVRNFGKAYGLNNVEYLSGSALKASDGTLYFGGMDGVTIVPNGTLNINLNIPSVIIDHCQVLDKPISQSIIQSQTPLRLSHWQNAIQFEFVALNFTYPEKNQYQYRLLGLNEKWIDADSSRSASFSYLPPRTYIFEVKGSNNDGVWNPKPASSQKAMQTREPFSLYGQMIS